MKKELKTIVNGMIGGMIGTLMVFTINVAAETLIGSEAVSYSNSATTQITVDGALDELFSAVDINEKIGDTDISDIGDGTITGAINNINSNISHVGMIVQSTKLDTMQKVIDIYGGTTWVKIEGRMLLGQSSSYAINSTGGSATNTLTVANLPSHTHSVGAHSHGLNKHTHTIPSHAHSLNNHTHSFTPSGKVSAHNHVLKLNGVAVKQGTSSDMWINNVIGGGSTNNTDIIQSTTPTFTGTSGTTGASSGNTGNSVVLTSGAASGSTANSSAFNSGATGSGTAVNNMPPYKVVYIWERTA